MDLSAVKGLESVKHEWPFDDRHRHHLRSQGQIPEVFLRGAGVPDEFITYMRSLVGRPIEFYSCFISYSSKDQEFAERLHADLQAKGVRCWFAPEDMKIGAETRQAIDEAIRLHDKLLLVLSEHSVDSDWVQKEVETAFEQERQRRKQGRRGNGALPGAVGLQPSWTLTMHGLPTFAVCATSVISPTGRTTTPTARYSTGCCGT